MASNLEAMKSSKDNDDDEKENIKDTRIPPKMSTPSLSIEESPSPAPSPDREIMTLDSIAARLIKDKLLLTALEFHSELVESGKELPRLRDFFSNPGNFEKTKSQLDTGYPSGLPRTSSCQTFDSLDFGHYSEDGDQQESEKVAVLEFELRKAQETIKSLRATLTQTAETEQMTSPENEGETFEEFITEDPQRPYEKRALNYLVNEYLLLNDNKLTSVTFAEENEDQDFEDWDDVGLNIAKPPDLLHLYRDFNQHTRTDVETQEVACGVDFLENDLNRMREKLGEVQQSLNQQIIQLKEQISLLTTEKEFISHKLQLAESNLPHSVVSSTPMTTPSDTPTKTTALKNKDDDNSLPTLNESSFPVCDSLSSLSADGSNLAVQSSDRTDSNDQKDNVPCDEDKSSKADEVAEQVGGRLIVEEKKSIVNLDIVDQKDGWNTTNRKLSDMFKNELMNAAFHVSRDNRIVVEISKLSEGGDDKVILMLGRCLPHIVPNVLLAKREELTPLIICAATLHPEANERDNLLNILFNLIKKPDSEQRQMILTGCVAFAQHVGASRVESELLPQCWEQINHKLPERRLLVAESCGALAPYSPPEIRSSLVMSMLKQMLSDDKAEEVRESVIRSLSLLVGFIDDKDKYHQAMELLELGLGDSSERVVSSCLQMLLPSLAIWAMELNILENNFIPSFVEKLEKQVKMAKDSQCVTNSLNLPIDRHHFLLLALSITHLVPVLFTSVLVTAPFAESAQKETQVQSTVIVESRLPMNQSRLTQPSVILGDERKLLSLIEAYEEYISQEWYEPWDTLIWVAGELVPQMIDIVNQVDVSSQDCVHSLAKFFQTLCRTFGRTFTITKIKPKFQSVLHIQEEALDQVASGHLPLTKCTVPVYSYGVLATFNQEEDHKHLSKFLQDTLNTLALCSGSLDALKSAYSELCTESDLHDLLLTVLWDGVVHTSAKVRAAAAKMFEMMIVGVSESLVSTRVIPALVTLANDQEIMVRISTVPAFGLIMEFVTSREMLDKVHMQFQTFMDDPAYKNQHSMTIELIKTFARVGPNSEPKFRDDFMLPRLAWLAGQNNLHSHEAHRLEIAMQLFEAYSALSCCFVSNQLVNNTMLPGLHSLLRDMQQLAPDNVPVIASMIRELENKVESGSTSDRLTISGQDNSPSHTEDYRNRMLNRLKDGRPNLSKIFGSKKS